MRTGPFDSVSRHAVAAISRRASLLSLGGAAMLAGASASRIGVAKKKNGDTCKKKEKKRCNNDLTACRDTIANYCATTECDPASALAFQACCDTCSVNGFITCQFALLP